MQYDVRFYYDKSGKCELLEKLAELKKKSTSNKDLRIQLRKIEVYIELLASHGLALPTEFIKKVSHDIWELRPGKNRILFFHFKDNIFVLTNMFQKKSAKTPRQELEKANQRMKHYIQGDNDND